MFAIDFSLEWTFLSKESNSISEGAEKSNASPLTGTHSNDTWVTVLSTEIPCEILSLYSLQVSSFSMSGIFGGLYGRMAILGAKTGNMENVLEKVATTYQEEADEEINDLIAVVEPTLVIVLSVIVGIILLSVMLPLLNIMSGMI